MNFFNLWAQKIWFELRIFSRKKSPKLSPIFLSLYSNFLWVRRNPAKFPHKVPAHNKKKLADKLLQERRENMLLTKNIKNNLFAKSYESQVYFLENVFPSQRS